MSDARAREMQARKALHPRPSPAASATLTTLAYHREPETRDFINETAEALTVARNDMVIQPALNNTPQPTASFTNRSMLTLLQVLLDLSEGRTHSLRHRVTMDREPAVPFRLGTLMSETQKVESLRSALTVSVATLNRVLSKLDQASLVLVQFQPKLGKPRVECFQARRCLAVAFETNHKVIRVTHNHHVSAALLAPPFDPQVEDVVQVHVGQQRWPVRRSH